MIKLRRSKRLSWSKRSICCRDEPSLALNFKKARNRYTSGAIQICVSTPLRDVPKNVLNLELTLDPFEKQLDLPALFVQLGNGLCIQVVGVVTIILPSTMVWSAVIPLAFRPGRC